MDHYLDAYRSHIRQLRGSGATVGKEMGLECFFMVWEGYEGLLSLLPSFLLDR